MTDNEIRLLRERFCEAALQMAIFRTERLLRKRSGDNWFHFWLASGMALIVLILVPTSLHEDNVPLSLWNWLTIAALIAAVYISAIVCAQAHPWDENTHLGVTRKVSKNRCIHRLIADAISGSDELGKAILLRLADEELKCGITGLSRIEKTARRLACEMIREQCTPKR